MRTALRPEDIDRIIEMAWEDRTPFDAIETQFGLAESDVIALMRRELRPDSFRLWRARVQGRPAKHRARRSAAVARFHSPQQRDISHNRRAKR
ncbi:MAG: TIGR03643 family protein [Bacteroidia bacterium]